MQSYPICRSPSSSLNYCVLPANKSAFLSFKNTKIRFCPRCIIYEYIKKKYSWLWNNLRYSCCCFVVFDFFHLTKCFFWSSEKNTHAKKVRKMLEVLQIPFVYRLHIFSLLGISETTTIHQRYHCYRIFRYPRFFHTARVRVCIFLLFFIRERTEFSWERAG